MMRRPERRRRHEARARRQCPRNGVDPRHFQRLFGPELREDRRKAPGEHRLPGPRWACEQEVVRPCSRELERAASAFLTPHVGEVRERRDLASARFG